MKLQNVRRWKGGNREKERSHRGFKRTDDDVNIKEEVSED